MGADGENSVSIMRHRNGYHRNMQTFSPDGITEALDTGQGGGRGHHVGIKVLGNVNPCGHGMNGNVYDSQAADPALTTNKGEGSQVAIPILTPDRVNKRQNGRHFKEDGEPMFTLTAQDRHGVVIEPIGGIYAFNSEKFGTPIYKDFVPTLKAEKHDTSVVLKTSIKKTNNDGIYAEMPGGFLTYCVWYEKYQCYIAIRKLTPKECFRLQGWSDEYFERAAFVNSDSQLYKQAGNGVTVDVVNAIGKQIYLSE